MFCRFQPLNFVNINSIVRCLLPGLIDLLLILASFRHALVQHLFLLFKTTDILFKPAPNLQQAGKFYLPFGSLIRRFCFIQAIANNRCLLLGQTEGTLGLVQLSLSNQQLAAELFLVLLVLLHQPVIVLKLSERGLLLSLRLLQALHLPITLAGLFQLALRILPRALSFHTLIFLSQLPQPIDLLLILQNTLAQQLDVLLILGTIFLKLQVITPGLSGSG